MSCPECATWAQCLQKQDWCEDLAQQSCGGAFDCVGRRRAADLAQAGPEDAELVSRKRMLSPG